jgi:hypothetical protein
MGYSQRAAILTVNKSTYINVSTRSLVFKSIPTWENETERTSVCYLSFEPRFGGQIVNPKLFSLQLKEFGRIINTFTTVKFDRYLQITIQIPFSMSQEEEFFADNIYRTGQQKLFDRLTNKSNKALSKFKEESVLLCTSGITEYVNLFK